MAEMTGRKGRIVRRTPKDVPAYEIRGTENMNSMDSLNVQEVGTGPTHCPVSLLKINSVYFRLPTGSSCKPQCHSSHFLGKY